MEEGKLESQVRSMGEGDVSAGETEILTNDEQHLAKLGYKQGNAVEISFRQKEKERKKKRGREREREVKELYC